MPFWHLAPCLVGQQAAPGLRSSRTACYIPGSLSHPSLPQQTFICLAAFSPSPTWLSDQLMPASIHLLPSPAHICLPSCLTFHLLLSSFQRQLLQQTFPTFLLSPLLSEHSTVFIKLSWDALVAEASQGFLAISTLKSKSKIAIFATVSYDIKEKNREKINMYKCCLKSHPFHIPLFPFICRCFVL